MLKYNQKWRTSGYGRAGFTLIQLLVVIGITVILLAIALLVIVRNRTLARLADCKANMRQILLAHRSYAQDFKDAKPPLFMQRTLTAQTDCVSPDIKWNGKPVGQGILVERKLLPLQSLMCPASEMAVDVARDTENWDNAALPRSGSSYAYFYRGLPAPAKPSEFATGVTYTRCKLAGQRTLIMEINAEEGYSYIGEYANRRRIAHARLEKLNVGYLDGSVQTFGTQELQLKRPGQTPEELAWFDEAHKRN